MSELAPGLKHSQAIVVTAEMTPPHLRAGAIRVLATPDMVRRRRADGHPGGPAAAEARSDDGGDEDRHRAPRGDPGRHEGHHRGGADRGGPAAARVSLRGARRSREGGRGDARALHCRPRHAPAAPQGQGRGLARQEVAGFSADPGSRGDAGLPCVSASRLIVNIIRRSMMKCAGSEKRRSAARRQRPGVLAPTRA